MQMKLCRLGYTIVGTPDGYFGSNTETAVRQFRADNNLEVDGFGGPVTLSMTEWYGRELLHSAHIVGYGNSDISSIEALARCIYGEDTAYETGQAAVAKELYNRKHSVRGFLSSGMQNTWKGIVYSEGQYTVMTDDDTNETKYARAPELYSDSWANCVELAQTLVEGGVPTSALGKQCFHRSSGSSYPSTSIAATRVQIPANVGNKFFDYVNPPT